MAEKLLDGAEISPVFQQMRGERMAENMGRDLKSCADCVHIFVECAADSPVGKAFPELIQEERGALAMTCIGCKDWPSAFQVFLYRVNRLPAKQGETLLAALPFANPKFRLVQVDVTDIEFDCFPGPDSAGIEELQ